MSALAEALVAAQRRALSAMEKTYVAGTLDGEQVVECYTEAEATLEVVRNAVCTDDRDWGDDE